MEHRKKLKLIKTINSIFAISFFPILIITLIKTIIKPNVILTSENRYAEKYGTFSIKGYLDKSVQDNIEKTLSDQIFISEKLRAANNLVKDYIVKNYIDTFLVDDELQYLSLGKVALYGKDYNLVYSTRKLSNLEPSYDIKIKNYNSVINNYPNMDIYFYYIEKDTDINFKTNEKVGAYEYLKNKLSTKNIARFKINNFNEFKEYFYKTDHHWNYKGSYKAYRQILELLKIKEQPLEGEEIDLNLSWIGSKATSYIFAEDFVAYRFRFPNMHIKINGKDSFDYGHQEEYCTGNKIDQISYANFYGKDSGEIIFETDNAKAKENLLVIGESFDNAILKLLASHYGTTFSIDLRHYEYYMGKPFDFDKYTKDHNISKVLFIGNIDFYQMPEFLIQEIN